MGKWMDSGSCDIREVTELVLDTLVVTVSSKNYQVCFSLIHLSVFLLASEYPTVSVGQSGWF